MYRKAYWPNESTKSSPKAYSPTPEGYKKSIDPKHVGQEGRTELHLSMLHAGDDDMHLEQVIKAGCDLNQRDKHLRTPAHYAAEQGKTRCLQVLAKHGAKFDVLDDLDHTPLMIAARHGFSNAVRILARSGANTNLPNSKGELALHYAVADGHLECVRELLALKSKVNYPDCQGSTPLILATKLSQRVIMELLLTTRVNTNHHDSFGKTALHWAAAIGSVTLIRLLLGHGADVDVFDKQGHSPFIYTILANHPEALQCLIDAGCDRSTVDGLNGTALGLTAIKGHARCAEILLRCHDDPDEFGFFGLTPLIGACFEALTDVVDVLLRYGANPNVAGRMGATPLMKSLIGTCPQSEVTKHDIVVKLLRAGADPNYRVVRAGYFTCVTNGKNCPLSFAICTGYVSLIEILLLAGATYACSELREWYNKCGKDKIDNFYDVRQLLCPIKRWKSQTRTLKHICRNVIRANVRVVGFEMSKAIHTLPIAPLLQEFVDLRDLDSIIPEKAKVDNTKLLQYEPMPSCGSTHMNTVLLQSLNILDS